MNDLYQSVLGTLAASELVKQAVGLVPRLLAAIVTVLAFYLAWRAIARGLAYAVKRAEIDLTASGFIESVVKYSLFVLGTISALGQVGVDTVSIVASLGVAGLTLGFAAKDVLSNLIAGLFIFWDRPFVIGDLVDIDGRYGTVERITLRSTRVVTPDGRMLAIPNTTIVNGTVASYTNFPHLRIDIPATVGVGENLGRVRDVLLKVGSSHPLAMKARPPRMVVKALNDYNVEVELQTWIEDEKGHIAARFEMREQVFEALRSAGVDMPYETLALTPIEMKKAA